MRNFKPELVLISAGFDSRVGDPLGQFTLSDADFTDLTNVEPEVFDRVPAWPSDALGVRPCPDEQSPPSSNLDEVLRPRDRPRASA